MEPIRFTRDADGAYRAGVKLRGRTLLRSSLLNKGTAFTREERRAFAIDGLLPAAVQSLEQQVERVYRSITVKTEPLERYIGLRSLQDRNETVFYNLLAEHLVELMPIVYTPTVGEGCRHFSRIYRDARGVFITPEHRGRIAEVLRHIPTDHIKLIVVTDNERILGLGDQGAGGIGIPIGKLALYTTAAGIHPSHTIPISLDVGTDNDALLSDPLYAGWRQERLRGEDYHTLVEEFVAAVKTCFPGALLQWEDFKKQNAFDLLDRYRDVVPSFNDDIQGTAAVATAALMAATRASGVPLAEQRVLILGAGAAGIGIARQLRSAMASAGLSGEELTAAIALLDSKGLLCDARQIRDEYKRDLAWPAALAERLLPGACDRAELLSVVEGYRPTVLIGTSGVGGAFTEDVVRSMAKHNQRPAIFPFSNPTSKSEATAEDLIRWTDGRALIATGSPFEPVEHRGKTYVVNQGNNVYAFPGVGLGALVVRAREVTDSMFTAAAEVLAREVDDAEIERGELLPRMEQLREITPHVAAAVARAAIADGVADELTDIEGHIRKAQWDLAYPRLDPT